MRVQDQQVAAAAAGFRCRQMADCSFIHSSQDKTFLKHIILFYLDNSLAKMLQPGF